MEPYTINPRQVPRWLLRNPNRRRSMQQEQLAWTGTEEQRARTTTDPAEFAQFPERFTWFHDRQRGQVFVREWRTDQERTLAGEDASKPTPILPHRYMRHVEKQGAPERTSLLGAFRAWRAGRHQAKAEGRWQPKRKGLD